MTFISEYRFAVLLQDSKQHKVLSVETKAKLSLGGILNQGLSVMKFLDLKLVASPGKRQKA